MKKTILSMIITVAIPFLAFGIDAKESELTAEDLASFLCVQHKTFTFEHDGSGVSYRFLIYKDGKIVHQGSIHRDMTSNGRAKKQRFSIVYETKGDVIRVVVKREGFVSRINIDKPRGIDDFSLVSSGVHFDDKNRLVLGYEVEPNADGGTVLTDENSTPEGAAAALVFELEAK